VKSEDDDDGASGLVRLLSMPAGRDAEHV
jgi:hypothetical protein